ncbi:MAG: TIGR00282 family metallophosphoesterase [Deltaproteobacteria bacterium]|nr:TIGR00282 family metallophosphoesterase [Deltaproteobacteria bacterium]
MKVLFIGDVFGEPGRRAIKQLLPPLRKEYGIDFVIANVENAAHGKGVTPKIIEELQEAGVGAFTSGNHIWDNREIIPYIKESKVLIRPANYLPTNPGRGSLCFDVYCGVKLVIINLEGQRLMGNGVSSPFQVVDGELEKWKGRADLVIVDIHAEATSEKRGMGWYLDGRVAAVVGTHTHVPTADEEVLPKGTAYITDIGMTGPYASVIGLKKEVALEKFVKQMPATFEMATEDIRLYAVLLELEERTGIARKITRVERRLK